MQAQLSWYQRYDICPAAVGILRSGLIVTLTLVSLSCGQKADKEESPKERSTKNGMTRVVNAGDAAANKPRSHPMRRSSAVQPPNYVAGPVLVRQILVDPETQMVLTEEGDSELCGSIRQRWDSWMKCVDFRLGDTYNWEKKIAFRLRWRSLKHLKVSSEMTRSGKPFRRLLHFRNGRAIEAGDRRTAMVILDLKKRESMSISTKGMLKGELVHAAAILPDGRVMLITVSGRRNPTARLRWWTDGDKQLRKPALTFKYAKKRFLGPFFPRMGMASRFLYVYCGAKDKVACDQIKLDGGIPYERWVQRDRAVAMAASRDGTKIALYIFGTLYLYHRSGSVLSLSRRWVDIFYVDKDSFIKRPGLVWDDGGKWLALTSSKRLNLVIETKSGRVIQLRDHAKPMIHVSYFEPALRGATFIPGSTPTLMYGDLRGGLVRYDLKTDSKHKLSLPEAKGGDHNYGQPDMITYLQIAGNHLVAWRGGAMYVLDSNTMRLHGRIGTNAGLGWSGQLSNLKIP